ncbi:type-F conjugative transfer system protein TraW [Xenorhabdus ishibashii]|uniref:Conjugal transfer protein TraW n=1 Tax=Xenorhabdus ishibashii TaxID=1034471 RepID=A0A2D0K7Y7_9GAMM|nr:type-F conjugative transfer system protein TraW [Xenorhabdus ishibashii]PHM59558.1 conjugal transfer protein TraW [Xenorhabdus ishibashii]
MNKKIIVVTFFLTFSCSALAKELGAVGNVWKIKERNLTTVMQERLAKKFENKSEEEIQDELRKRVEERAIRPDRVEGITKATKTVIKYFDPSFTVTKDLTDHNGVVFARKGQIFNPFDMSGFTQTLIFIDGDDIEQLNWVNNFKPKTLRSKIILVNGNIKDTETQLKKKVYFDQLGELTKRFNIQYVPSIIESAPDEKKLKITEIGL